MQPQYTSRYAITFGQVGILHIGSEQFGKIAQNGFSVLELNRIKELLIEKYRIAAQIIDLSQKLPKEAQKDNQAGVLYLPGAVDAILGNGAADRLYEQQQKVKYDTKYFNAQRQKTLNKRARHNIVFSNFSRQHSEDYRQFSVCSFKEIHYLSEFRQIIGKILGPKAENLNADGNKYYEEASGIGFHGDSQRKIIICLSLGRTSTIRYYWRTPKSYKNEYGPIDINVKHGDIYIMSEKASGFDWLKSKRYRLVHAAGSIKYIGQIKQPQIQPQNQQLMIIQ